jgi:hypothetical protein
MKHRQRGISLVWVAIVAGALALVGMIALMSMRNETNYFAAGVNKAMKALPGSVQAAASAATAAAAPAGQSAPGPLRRCIIDGRTVISNTACTADNKTSRAIALHETRGIEAPKVPPKEDVAKGTGGDPMLDKVIDQQGR